MSKENRISKGALRRWPRIRISESYEDSTTKTLKELAFLPLY